MTPAAPIPATPRHDGLHSTHYALPLDIVLALPTSSVPRALIQERRDRGDWPRPLAQVFARDHQYFALVGFEGPDHSDLLFKLDVWVWAGPGGGG